MRLKITLMLAPALAVLGVLFFGGLGAVLLRSFNYMPVIGRVQPNFDAYGAVFQDPAFGAALGLSLYIALVSTAISAVLGLGAALLLREQFAGRRAALVLFQLNQAVPHLVGAIGILYLFSQSGSFARLAFAAGAIVRPADFPILIFDPYAIGIILQYIWKEVPFIGMVVLANLQTFGPEYEAAARSHGASARQSLIYVLLPMLMPALLGASIVVFTFAFSAYEVPLLLGQNHPVALSVLAYRSYADVDLAARPQAMAMGMVIAAISAGLVAIYARILRQ